MIIHDPPTSLLRVIEILSSDRHSNGSQAVIENLSDKDIVGIAALWVNRNLATANGKPRQIRQLTDSFAIPGPLQPVVAAQSRSFIGPGFVTPVRLTAPGVGHIGAFPHPDANAPGWDLTFDAILFADGELVGPDTLHLRETIINRKTAATRVAAPVRRAMVDNGNLSVVFAELTDIPTAFRTSTPSIEAVMELNEIRCIARDLQFSQNNPERFEMQLSFLEALPEPVKIFRPGDT
jgi:hypothetical protein